MKISARNVFDATLTAVKDGPVNAEVELRLASGETLVAAITEGSVQSLGLAPGRAVKAVVKAPLVLLATETEGWAYTARNRYAGVVASIEKGAVNSAVSLALPSGTTISSVITNSAVDELGLKPGVAATALFKAGSVLLALQA